MSRLQLVSEFQPTGDQPEAIAALVKGIRRGYRHQTLWAQRAPARHT